ncbi:DUF2325 domain-containing protein [Dehalobacter sp. DCM]|uniref:DUF2325 domain-containing protein n=1 Tax=Dehalobacter sp. DCM TaxID=2907827 RepID=UPI003081ACE7|nr:DUF2325 domain-containing protein [Dehalobacter sp. DCM]
MKIAIIGGFNIGAFSRESELMANNQIRCHDGYPKKRNKKVLNNLIRDSDYVIIVQDACSHLSMWEAKESVKKYKKNVCYSRSHGLATITKTIEKELAKQFA